MSIVLLKNVRVLVLFAAVVGPVTADCPPIHTILNGELIAQPDPVCLARENPVVDASIKCSLLNAPENGFFVGLCQPLVGFSCKFGCMNGFALTHSNPLNCMSSGLWSSPPPACENIIQPTNDCDLGSVKALFKNGFINCNQNEKAQLVCRFFCFNGFVITGNPMLTCQANGKFNSMPPSCVSIESTNSLVEYNHSPLTSPNLVYSKPFNYFVTSNSIQCPQLSHLKSGSMNCDCSSNNYKTGCTCRFFCNEEYYLLGAPMLQCTKFGNWSAANPVCRRE